MNVYLALTEQFNEAALRAVISSGQAALLHGVAIMGVDGAWILREDAGALDHVLGVLSAHGARYRFGAPLDTRWMSGGWSSHFEFRRERLRVRCDFVTRPPRISARRLEEIWREQEGRDVPFLDATDLVEIKKTSRDRDYAVIGELTRLISSVRDQFLCSQSARDLIELAGRHPDLARELSAERPALGFIAEGRQPLQEAIYRERIALITADEERLSAYTGAAEGWSAAWPEVQRRIAGLPLPQAHEIVVERAEDVLPFEVEAGDPGERNGRDA